MRQQFLMSQVVQLLLHVGVDHVDGDVKDVRIRLFDTDTRAHPA